MKRALLTTVMMLVMSAFALGAGDAPKKVYVNTDWWGLALSGYDPVGYFTDGKAVAGKEEFVAKHQGATYRFASAEHRDLFAKDPAKYAPQFGGYCAWAVSQGYTANIDPNAFDIIDGRLIVQYSLDVREKFRKDTKGNLAAADANWPRILESKGKAPKQ